MACDQRIIKSGQHEAIIRMFLNDKITSDGIGSLCYKSKSKVQYTPFILPKICHAMANNLPLNVSAGPEAELPICVVAENYIW